MNPVIERQNQLVDNFSLFEEPDEKYEYLISLSQQLPPYPEDKKDAEHQIKGCQSNVWFDMTQNNGYLHFKGVSDAIIVSGLIGLLLYVYNDAKPQDICQSDTTFMQQIGLDQQLSPTRKNGLHAMVQYIYQNAKAHCP